MKFWFYLIFYLISLGIIPRAIVHIFEGKERDEDKDTIYTVHVSYVEIYNEEIRDLLNEDQAGKKLDIKGNHGVIGGDVLKRHYYFRYHLITKSSRLLNLDVTLFVLELFISRCYFIEFYTIHLKKESITVTFSLTH